MNRKTMTKVAVIATAGCAALALAGPAAAAPPELLTVHVVQFCTGGGQFCNGVENHPIITTEGEKVNLEFTADPGHCSDVQVNIGVDNVRQGEFVLSPGERSGALIVGPLSSGFHDVFVSAVGIEGGCNVGKLGSWGGDLLVQRLA